MKQTKIICTLGPSTNDRYVLADMMKEGMDVARLNFSHSNKEQHEKTINLLKKTRKEEDKFIPLLADTKGPEIRTGFVEGYDEDEEAFIELEKGDFVDLICDSKAAVLEGERCTSEEIYVTYDYLTEDVEEGQKILIDDGSIELEVVEIFDSRLKTKVLTNGELESRKGVNVPNAEIRLPTLSRKDKEDIKFAIEKGADFIALSFVRNAENVVKARSFIDENGGEDIKIISKIENKEGVNNMAEILDLSDGLMIARGDLGVEIPYSSVPGAQQRLIDRALEARKTVITATEMLDSMRKNPTPTRAEVSDVYNAVRQGTTCVMLSGETATGDYPVESVKAMASTIKSAERDIDYQKAFYNLNFDARGHVTTSVCHAVVDTAYNVNAECIVAFSNSGHTARNVSAFRPKVPIVVVSPRKRVVRQCHMMWGVQPVLKEEADTIEGLFENASEVVKKLGFAEPGDSIVSVAGTPVGVPGSTNTLRVIKMGEVLVKGYPFSKGKVEGKVKICRSPSEASKIEEGDIAVFFKLDSGYEEFFDKAGAVLVASSNYDKKVIEKANEKEIPVLVDVRSVTERLEDGMEVVVRADKGAVLKS